MCGELFSTIYMGYQRSDCGSHVEKVRAPDGEYTNQILITTGGRHFTLTIEEDE